MPCTPTRTWRDTLWDWTEPLWQRLQEQKEAAEAAQQELFANRLCTRPHPAALLLCPHTRHWGAATGPPRALDQDELAFLRDVEAEECEKERAEQREVQQALSEFKVGCCCNGGGWGGRGGGRAGCWLHGGAVCAERAGCERGGPARDVRDAGTADARAV